MRPTPLSPAQAFLWGGGLFILGVLLPALASGQVFLLLTAPLLPEPRPFNPALFFQAFREILPQNLAILLLAAYGIPLLPRIFPRTPRTIPLIYALVQCFTLGLLASPAGIAFGLAYFLLSLPIALLEGGSYLLAGLYGQSRAFRLPPLPGLLPLSLLLLLGGGVYEAWVVAVFWR